MWQTVSARIRGTKSELVALGEETDNVVSTSKLRDLVKGYTGVDIMKDANTYKDMYAIISEIGKVWKDLEDVDRAAVLEALAGKKQSNTLAAVLNNHERLEDIYKTAENSAGSAREEQRRYAESLQYSIDQLTAHSEEFWQTFINKDDIKDFIDLINVLIGGATKLVDAFGSIPSVAAIFGGFAALRGKGLFGNIDFKSLFGKKTVEIRTEVDESEVEALQAKIAALDGDEVKIRAVVEDSSLGDIPGMADYAVDRAKEGKNIDVDGVNILNADYIAQQAHGLSGVNSAIGEYNRLKSEGAGAEKKFAEALGKSNKNLSKYLTGLKSGKANITTYGLSLVGATAKTIALKTASMALSAAISMGISIAIQFIIELFDKLIVTSEEALEKSREVADKQREQFQETKSEYEELCDLVDEYKDLSMSENWDNASRERALEIQREINGLTDKQLEGLDGEIEKRKQIIEQLEREKLLKLGDTEAEAYETQDRDYDTLYDSLSGGWAGAGTGISIGHYTYTDSKGKTQNGTSLATLQDSDGKELQYDPDKVGNTQNKILSNYSRYFKKSGDKMYFYIPDLNNDGKITKGTEYQQAYEALINMRNDLKNAGLKDTYTYGIIDSIINTYSEDYYRWKNSNAEWHEIADQKAYKNALMGANNGNLNIDSFESFKKVYDSDAMKPYREMLGADFVEYMARYNKEKGIKNGDYNDYKPTFNDRKLASEKLEPIGKAFKEISQEGYVTSSTIEDINKTIGGSIPNWDRYIKALQDSNTSSKERNEILNELTYSTLRETLTVHGLANATEDEIALMLKERGVLNSLTLARQYSSRAKFESKLISEDLKDATDANNDGVRDVIALLVAEGEQLNLTKIQIMDLIRAEIMFGENDLGIIEKIELLNTYAEAILGVKNVLSDITVEDSATDKEKWAEEYGVNIIKGHDGWWTTEDGKEIYAWGYEYDGVIYDKPEEASLAMFQDKISGGAPVWDAPVYSSGSSSGKNEALDNHLKAAERRYKVHQDETMYISELDYALKNLCKTEEEELDLQEKIRDAFKSRVDNQVKDIEHRIDLKKNLYGDDVNTVEDFKEIQNIVSKNADEYREYMRGLGYSDEIIEATDEIQGWQKTWWDAQGSIVDWEWNNSNNWIEERNKKGDWALYGDSEYKAWQRVAKWLKEKYPNELDKIHEAEQNAIDARYNYSKDWISERNTYNDWALFDDSEVDAWERVVKWLKEEYPNDLKKIKEAEESLFNARKKEFNNATNFGNTYLGAQKTLLESYHNVTNSIAEAQHEINKELETSKTMYEYLDEDTRKLLFNQDDYNELSEELLDIQYRADKLQRQYKRDLENSTLETIESITSNYQMQYETLMKSYEIAKADLEIAKKKAKLNNVLNERNVRMFINGSWQWVANTEDVANAKSELADAEYAKRVEESGLTQQQSINNLTRQQDALGVVIKQFEGGVINLDRAVLLAKQAIGNIPTAIESLLNNASSSSSGGANRGSSGGRVLQVGIDGNAPSGATIGDTIRTAGGDYKIVSEGTSGAKYNPNSGH